MTDSTHTADIINALRDGLVPNRGLEQLATGLHALSDVFASELDYVGQGRGRSKWLRGEYGSGKTFATRFLCAQARQAGFATAEVQISINDTPLHRLETVYRRLIERLETDADGPAAFQAIIDSWLYDLGDQVTELEGIEEDDPRFAAATEARLEDRLAELSKNNSSFPQLLRAYHKAGHEGDLSKAQQILGWLSAEPNIRTQGLKSAGIKGKVDGATALNFLGGLLLLLRQSSYRGLVVVLDEVETIQQLRRPEREKALNVLRQLMDMLANEQLPGLYLLVTGTRDFFEGYKGIQGLAPLAQRVGVKFGPDSRFDNLKAPQVRLPPFTQDRLLEVGEKVQAMYPAQHRDRVDEKLSRDFLRRLVSKVSDGFGGEVAVVPRIFLRELIDILDRIDQHEDYSPSQHYQLTIDEADLKSTELFARRRRRRPMEEKPGEATPQQGEQLELPRRLRG